MLDLGMFLLCFCSPILAWSIMCHIYTSMFPENWVVSKDSKEQQQTLIDAFALKSA